MLTSACKRSTDSNDEASTKAHLFGPRVPGLLNVEKARMGLYKAVGTQYCTSGNETLIEYHVKKLEEHLPVGAPLYGYVCISKNARNAQLFDGEGDALARARRMGTESKPWYEILSDVGGNCDVGSLRGNVLAQAKTQDFFQDATDWRRRIRLKVCPTANGSELVSGVHFIRDLVSPGIVNESWRLRKVDATGRSAGAGEKKDDDLLASIWTNPAWGSWSVEDLQEGAPYVHRAVLYMLPIIEEMRRREKPATSGTPSVDSASPGAPTPGESDPFPAE